MQAPEEIANNEELAEIWNRVTGSGERADDSNVELYVQLCWWYLELRSCRRFATAKNGEARVFAPDDKGNLVTLPFTAEMERAQKAIDGIESRLGVKPAKKGEKSGKATILQMVINDRADKAKKAANGS